MRAIHTCAPFLLDESGAEMIFAPFFHSDSKVNRHLPVRLEPLSASGCRLEDTWANLQVRWDRGEPGTAAWRLTWTHPQEVDGYDELILCLVPGSRSTIRARVECEGSPGHWVESGPGGKRKELTVPLNGSRRIERIELEAVAQTSGSGQVILNWFGLANTAAAAARRERCYRFDPAWPGLLVEDPDWDQPAFARGLLFDADRLPALRERRNAPNWDRIFGDMERRAAEWMNRCPEEEIARFIPYADSRFMRTHQVRNESFFSGPLILALVGLVNRDERMIRQALRFLMAFLHATHWCPAENRIAGSTWDSKCFWNEQSATHVALLADWLDTGLTRHAKELVRKCIWDKGLAIVERDLMKYDYMWSMNQGPWFCRGRILGGLMLENKWPRMGDYVDRAYRDMIEMMEQYILPDGGVDEGLGYLCATLDAMVPSVLAYARARGIDPIELMPKHFDQVEHYVATLSGLVPGTLINEGDTGVPRLPGDAFAILASLLPESLYPHIFAGSAEQIEVREDTRPHKYDYGLSFPLGPDRLEPAKCVVPTFSRLEQSGHLTSCRRTGDHAVRLHLTGAKAGAGHTHRDKGGIILEVDEQPLLIDRGIVRYDDDRHAAMGCTRMHNAVTPILADGFCPDQAPPQEAQVPDGEGDDTALSARIDLSHVWREHMDRCERHIESPTPVTFVVTDRGTRKMEGPVAFHLQALRPFVVEDDTVHLPFDGGRLVIEAPWATRFEQAIEGVDLHFQDVHRAVWYSAPVREFSLETRLRIEFDQ